MMVNRLRVVPMGEARLAEFLRGLVLVAGAGLVGTSAKYFLHLHSLGSTAIALIVTHETTVNGLIHRRLERMWVFVFLVS